VFRDTASQTERSFARLTGRLATAATVTLAVVRVGRFFTTDKAGEWWVVGPAKRWAWRSTEPNGKAPWPTVNAAREQDYVAQPMETPLPSWGWRSKLVSIFDCGFCLAPWLTGAAIIVEALTSPRVPVLRRLRPVWRWLTLTLAGSYVAGHIWNRLDNH
jgi:hypothetical protein